MLQIKFYGPGIKLESVTINERIPMTISLWRIGILFGVITFIYCIRNLEVFQKSYNGKNIKQEFILLGVLGVFLCLIYFINNYSTNENFDFYCYNFVNALSHGRISLEERPDQRLFDMENPYDTAGRDEVGIRKNIHYFWDTVFYNGEVYVYFGILPVLTLFLPFHLITGKYLLSATGVLVFSILAAIAIKALVEIVFKRYFKDIPFKYVVFSLLIMLFGSQILVLNGFPRFYEVPIAAGIFCAIAGIDFVLMSLKKEKVNYIEMFVGCAFLAAAVACRPTQLLTSLIIVPFLLKQFIENIKNRKHIIRNILAVAIPYLTIGILLMIYNYVRFGSILEFGAQYQLTIHDMTHLSNRWATLGVGLVCSLFSIPNFLPNFPFIDNHNNLITFYGYYYVENMIGGLFIVVPICFFIFKLRTIYKKSENRDLVKFIITLTVVGMLICILSIVMAGSMQRYIVDYGWMLVLAGVCIFIELHSNLYVTGEAKNILKKIFAYITIYVVIVNTCSGIISEKNFMRSSHPAEFFKVKYIVDFWE